jgi:hypothetical protein
MKRALFLSLALSTSTFVSSAYADRVEYFARGEEGRSIEFGSGADGEFADGPTQTGITVVGAAIAVNTDVKSVYEFSSFTLSGGFTMTVSGSLPLFIRVTGASTIAGIILIDGGTGGAATIAAPTATGGAAGAGGARGGIGGERFPDTPPTAGSPSVSGSGGGIQANEAGITGQNAGGGGCHGTGGAHPATAGTGSGAGGLGGAAASCALSPAAIADRFESDFTSITPGGAGGGGGSTRANAANNMNGAGGGGGGGAIRLASRGALAVTGAIRARGGAGGAGDVVVTDYGASGGGGAGGSIWIQSASTVSGAGILDVSGGVGGQDTGPASFGGNGSRGVIRVDAGTHAYTGTYVPANAVDQAYPVYPVTTEFTLSGGPGCGSLRTSTDEPPMRGVLTFFAWISFFVAYRFALRARIPRFRVRAPN